MRKPRTLYVKRTHCSEVSRKWGYDFYPPGYFTYALICYVQCDKDGIVNWDKASVYTIPELIERNNVKIVK